MIKKLKYFFLNIMYVMRLEPTISTLTALRSIQRAKRNSSEYMIRKYITLKPGCVAQSVTCLTAISGVASSIPARSHTFVEIDHERISTVILLPSADLFKKGCCQLSESMCTNYSLSACSSLPRKKCG